MSDKHYLTRLDKAALRFMGGAVILQAYGCGFCGGGFWIEENSPRENPPESVKHCPHCSRPSLIPGNGAGEEAGRLAGLGGALSGGTRAGASGGQRQDRAVDGESS